MKSIIDFQAFKKQILDYKSLRPEKEDSNSHQDDQRGLAEKLELFKLSYNNDPDEQKLWKPYLSITKPLYTSNCYKKASKDEIDQGKFTLK